MRSSARGEPCTGSVAEHTSPSPKGVLRGPTPQDAGPRGPAARHINIFLVLKQMKEQIIILCVALVIAFIVHQLAPDGAFMPFSVLIASSALVGVGVNQLLKNLFGGDENTANGRGEKKKKQKGGNGKLCNSSEEKHKNGGSKSKEEGVDVPDAGKNQFSSIEPPCTDGEGGSNHESRGGVEVGVNHIDKVDWVSDVSFDEVDSVSEVSEVNGEVGKVSWVDSFREKRGGGKKKKGL